MMRLVGVVLPVLLAACATTPQAPTLIAKRAPLVWPAPPDLPRFAYETVLRSGSDIAPRADNRDKLFGLLAGRDVAASQPAFDKPAAIVARQGRIYVADTGNETIVVFDVPRRKMFRFGQRSPNALGKPSGLALDAHMNVYVADAKRRQIMVFDSLGLYLRTIGGPDDLVRPVGVAVSRDGERIYAIDRADNESDQHRVVIYASDGSKIGIIGTRGGGSGQFNVPLQAVSATDGTLYVLDAGNFRVQAFGRDGNFLHAFGKPGVNPGNFARPRGIAVDDDGNVYVTDAAFNNVQIFRPDGQLLLAIGESGHEDIPGRFGLLSGVAVDETGRVYAVDQLFSKVEVFRPIGELEAQQVSHKQ